MIERYKNDKATSIWSEKSKLDKWLQIEKEHITTLYYNKEVTHYEYDQIIKSLPNEINEEHIEKWKMIEKSTKHDVAAFVDLLEGLVPEGSDTHIIPVVDVMIDKNPGRWIHYGLTSSDILDTATSLQCLESIRITNSLLSELIYYINKLSKEYKHLSILGRTHGVAAELQPISSVFDRWVSQLRRAHDSLLRCKEIVGVGKLSGATGNNTINSELYEQQTLDRLGLKRQLSSQIIPRDIYMDFFYGYLKVMTTVEKIAFDIRMYSQEFIGEMSESFSSGQKGSSAMPHKKNPIGCENLFGMANLYKSCFITAMNNCLTLFERDISNSGPERIIFEDSTHLVFYSLERLTKIIKNLVINEEKINENINKVKDKINSQVILANLIDEGYSRKESYAIVKEISHVGLEETVEKYNVDVSLLKI